MRVLMISLISIFIITENYSQINSHQTIDAFNDPFPILYYVITVDQSGDTYSKFTIHKEIDQEYFTKKAILFLGTQVNDTTLNLVIKELDLILKQRTYGTIKRN